MRLRQFCLAEPDQAGTAPALGESRLHNLATWVLASPHTREKAGHLLSTNWPKPLCVQGVLAWRQCHCLLALCRSFGMGSSWDDFGGDLFIFCLLIDKSIVSYRCEHVPAAFRLKPNQLLKTWPADTAPDPEEWTHQSPLIFRENTYPWP